MKVGLKMTSFRSCLDFTMVIRFFHHDDLFVPPWWFVRFTMVVDIGILFYCFFLFKKNFLLHDLIYAFSLPYERESYAFSCFLL